MGEIFGVGVLVAEGTLEFAMNGALERGKVHVERHRLAVSFRGQRAIAMALEACLVVGGARRGGEAQEAEDPGREGRDPRSLMRKDPTVTKHPPEIVVSGIATSTG
jgi:hypothetical protein